MRESLQIPWKPKLCVDNTATKRIWTTGLINLDHKHNSYIFIYEPSQPKQKSQQQLLFSLKISSSSLTEWGCAAMTHSQSWAPSYFVNHPIAADELSKPIKWFTSNHFKCAIVFFFCFFVYKWHCINQHWWQICVMTKETSPHRLQDAAQVQILSSGHRAALVLSSTLYKQLRSHQIYTVSHSKNTL